MRSVMPANFHKLIGWTPEALSAELGVARESIANWESRTGHRLDRTCVRCGNQRVAEDMRYNQVGALQRVCVDCPPSNASASRDAEIPHFIGEASKPWKHQAEGQLQYWAQPSGMLTKN